MPRLSVLALSVAFGFSPVVFAELPYAGFQGGVSVYEDACSGGSLNCNDDTFTYGGYGGYPLLSWLTFEVGVMDYGSPDARYSDGSVSADVWGVDASLLASYSLFDELSVYGRAGGAWLSVDKNTDDSGSSLEPLFGVGLSYLVTPNWAVRGEYRFIDGIGDTTTDKADLHTFLFGVSYRFDLSTPVASLPVTLPPEEAPSATVLPASPSYTLELNALSFSTNEVALSEQGVAQLTEWVPELERSVGVIKVTGHTDDVGAAAYNQGLSERRAKAVASYLSAQGIDAQRFDVSGMGEASPKASNATAEGRAINRRVEIEYEREEQQ